MNVYAAQIEAGNYSTFRVCVDCYYAHHGIGESDTDHTPDRVPLSLVPDTADVKAGMRAEDHECGRQNGEEIDECECEMDSFSWSACDGCGSPSGGTRHALFVVYDVRPAA